LLTWWLHVQFLSFFKMAIRLFAAMFFFAAVVLEPINMKFSPDSNPEDPKKSYLAHMFSFPQQATFPSSFDDGFMSSQPAVDRPRTYLWAYIIFVYFFTMLTVWFINSETFRVIKIRQDYLGTQSTITDRTFRFAGIPKGYRSEDKIKKLVEKLEIGQVESVTLCRNWKELDALVAQRSSILSKLEESWGVYLSRKPLHSIEHESRAVQESTDESAVVDEEAGENGRLLPGEIGAHQFTERERPKLRLRYGFLRLRSRKTDALDYYEEKLRQLDESIRDARKKEYEPADLAFVTMDSIAACQMAIQALVDPHPGELLTKLAPAPSDVVWHNTYAPRTKRRIRSWIVTIFVAVLSIVWLIPVASLASLLSLCAIGKWAPGLADSLAKHEVTKALFQTGIPTATVSLLNIAVPYVYDFLSNYQGMLSQGDVELSIISKNFFFTFFNIFLTFTTVGAATGFWTVLQNSIKDTTYLAYRLAGEVQRLSIFYLNFIMLQGVGLFPFRLLEFGSVAMYPIYRMGAKTPRDFAQIMAPPTFSYGFYLPTALLIFILCLVYSVMPGGYQVLFFGLIYFTLGYFTYKYQLIYAMDVPQHATGGAWRLICYRIMLGLGVFQLTMGGYLGANKAFVQAVLVAPMLAFTVWYSYYFRRRFEPLTRFISLRSIRRSDDEEEEQVARGESGGRSERLLRRGSTIDEDREHGLRFVNPSLVVPYVVSCQFLADIVS
jgi:calcium permeable stress-gated cation channel